MLDKEARRHRKNAAARKRYAANPDKRRAYSREWWARNPARRRDYWYKKKYGILLADYNKFLVAQGGVCAACRQPERHYKTLCLDHSHVTGHIRGLLCHKCNTALGMVDDRPDILMSLIRYLQGGSHGSASATPSRTDSCSMGH